MVSIWFVYNICLVSFPFVVKRNEIASVNVFLYVKELDIIQTDLLSIQRDVGYVWVTHDSGIRNQHP